MMNKTHVFERCLRKKVMGNRYCMLIGLYYPLLALFFYDHFVKNLLSYTFFVRMYLENFLTTDFMLLSLLVEVNKSQSEVHYSTRF